MESRGQMPVSPPQPCPTTAYWQDPPSDIATLRSTETLPGSADFVIIGSGISGACIAYNLLTCQPGASVVMLEARTACSGATGRNGGHTKAATYRSFLDNVENLGLDEATRIAKLERANILETHAFAKEHGIDCDSFPCQTVDVMYNEGHWAAGLKAVKYMDEVLGQGEDRGVETYKIHDTQATGLEFLCPNALGAIEYPAGSISGYKFVIGLLKICLSKGLNLQTNRSVTSIEQDGSHLWVAHMDSGLIKTPKLILATNGYTAHLLKQFQGIIVPLRGQVSAQRPGRSLPYDGSLPTTYSFIYDVGYEYMIPRPAGSKFAGDIVIGGGWAKALPENGASEFGTVDDSVTDDKVSEYLKNCTAEFFGQNWGEDDEEGRVRKEWTGIMGTSADGLPYIGAVPGTKGLWTSASFDGHGMVLCLKCAEAITSMILGTEDVDGTNKWFPNSFRITEKRLKHAFEGRRNVKLPPEPLETRSHM